MFGGEAHLSDLFTFLGYLVLYTMIREMKYWVFIILRLGSKIEVLIRRPHLLNIISLPFH